MSEFMRSLGRSLHGRLIYPAAVRLVGEGHLFQRLAELRELERRPSADLVAYQTERLARLLAYAHARSPFYRERWGRRVSPDPQNALAELQNLPFVTKQDLQQHLDSMLARPRVSRTTLKITGGSTGQAVSVVKDRRATAYERAAMWLGYGWRGVVIGDRAARFWGSPFAVSRRSLTRVADWAMHRIRFSAFAFEERDLERYWRDCLRFRPDYFHGYVSMLEAFARFVETRAYNGRALGLRAVIATSEVLTSPQRETLVRVFGAPVLIEYGCGELGPIAYDCEAGALHLLTTDVVVEVLRPDGQAAGPGESGEIVVTDLNNRAMPLIRYRLGDFGVPGPGCACGRGFPTLERIWGRAYDFVDGPDGKRYHGEFFMYLFEDLRRRGAGIEAFQVTQAGPARLEIEVVTSAPLTGHQETAIRELLRERLPGMEVQIVRVHAIERTASGKMQVIRNQWLRGTASVPSGEGP
jgi:phenylacetate-CoA ligase